jgi:hypothetical protein
MSLAASCQHSPHGYEDMVCHGLCFGPVRHLFFDFFLLTSVEEHLLPSLTSPPTLTLHT